MKKSIFLSIFCLLGVLAQSLSADILSATKMRKGGKTFIALGEEHTINRATPQQAPIITGLLEGAMAGASQMGVVLETRMEDLASEESLRVFAMVDKKYQPALYHMGLFLRRHMGDYGSLNFSFPDPRGSGVLKEFVESLEDPNPQKLKTPGRYKMRELYAFIDEAVDILRRLRPTGRQQAFDLFIDKLLRFKADIGSFFSHYEINLRELAIQECLIISLLQGERYVGFKRHVEQEDYIAILRDVFYLNGVLESLATSDKVLMLTGIVHVNNVLCLLSELGYEVVERAGLPHAVIEDVDRYAGEAVAASPVNPRELKSILEQRAETRSCPTCGKTEDLKRCTRCKKVWYCGEEHQRADWPEHKKVCKKPAK